MVRFVTLFLGLLIGEHDVEVMVGTDVAAVELRLDGASVARIEGEPWTAAVDFGAALGRPQLEAIAFDAEGTELDRTTQPINSPRPPAEVELLLERDTSGRPVAVRVEWQSVDFERPAEVHLTLDGDRLLELGPHRFGLPPVDLESFHLIQADVRFGEGLRASARVSFGGEYLAETTGELTGILVSVAGRKRTPAPEAMSGWFVVDGEPLRVVAVEEGPVELIFVSSESAAQAITTLEGLGYHGGGRYSGPSPIPADSPQLRKALSVPDHYRLRLLAPRATRVSRGQLSFEAFLVSPSLTAEMGVYWALWQRFRINSETPQPRLSDAVATAGLQAVTGQRRRAVVLVTADAGPDFSLIGPTVAVDYLRELAVPLFVWQIGPGEPTAGWPDAVEITSYRDLRRAVRDLEKAIARQRVVWFDQGHDPRRIRLVEPGVLIRIGSG